jgi:hypothetical protein
MPFKTMDKIEQKSYRYIGIERDTVNKIRKWQRAHKDFTGQWITYTDIIRAGLYAWESVELETDNAQLEPVAA